MIAATNRDLKQMVAEGKFREDLFYRLSAFPLGLPPLRERRADIAALARFFLDAARRSTRPFRGLPRAPRSLLLYDWPGNVRELENMMERVAILRRAGGSARPAHRGAPRPARPLKFKDIERQAIEDALP